MNEKPKPFCFDPARYPRWAADPTLCDLSEEDHLRLHGMGVCWWATPPAEENAELI